LAQEQAFRRPPDRLHRLEPFNLSWVRLLDGPLKKHFDANRKIFLDIPHDAILFGFRHRAGLPSPDKSLDGWYSKDYSMPSGSIWLG
jgi:hypothetical protein